jgi:hypothetical protein
MLIIHFNYKLIIYHLISFLTLMNYEHLKYLILSINFIKFENVLQLV